MQFPHSGPQMDSSFASQSGGGLGTGDPPPVEAKPKIHHTQATAITKKIDWKRKPHSDGTGACHVKTFHSRNFGAARTHLYVVGVFNASAVERAIRASFASWAPGSAATSRPPTPRTAHSVTLLDRPKAVQSTIMVGLPVLDPAAEDFTALSVTDALLGGTFGSRITTNIREQKGHTYSPFSYVNTHRRMASCHAIYGNNGVFPNTLNGISENPVHNTCVICASSPRTK